MRLNKKAKQLLETKLSQFCQNATFDTDEGNEWIPKKGCLLCCIVAAFCIFSIKSMFTKCDQYLEIFKSQGIIKDDLIQWYKLKAFYKTMFSFKWRLWDGKHKDIKSIKANMVDTLSVVSVDYKGDKRYKNRHWILVLFKSEHMVIFDPFTGIVDYFPEKYLINDSEEQSIFSIVTIKILL